MFCFPAAGHQGGALGLEGVRHRDDKEVLVGSFETLRTLVFVRGKQKGKGSVWWRPGGREESHWQRPPRRVPR